MHTAHPPALGFLVPPLSPSQQILAVPLAPGVENILSAHPPGQRQSPTTRCSHFMCSGMHMDAQVQPLDKGQGPVRRGSLLRDRGKGHLSAAANLLSSVTFVIVAVISACHHSPPLRQRTPRAPRWCGESMPVPRFALPATNSNGANVFTSIK